MSEDLHPEFVREALAGTEPSSRRELLEIVHRLPEALPPSAGSAGVRARLLAEASKAPERYAPFARRLAELYDLPRADVRSLLRRSADERAWKFSGLPGIRKLQVAAGPLRQGAQAYLVKFAAGVHFPAHHHDGLETVLIMAGAYTDGTGQRFVTGDTHIMEAGTSHSFTIDRDEDCVAAALLHGRLNFRSLPLRWLARLLGH